MAHIAIAGEFSGIVRDAFRRRGHDAVSCDYRPSEQPGPHYQGSWFDQEFLKLKPWDLWICHPDCTFLVVSGARWMSIPWREEAQLAALHTVKALYALPVARMAIENPVGKLSSLWRGPDQIIQPYQFGDPFKKTTGLWLKNLPLLVPTNDLGDGRRAGKNRQAPSGRRTGRGPTRGLRTRWPSSGAQCSRKRKPHEARRRDPDGEDAADTGRRDRPPAAPGPRIEVPVSAVSRDARRGEAHEDQKERKGFVANWGARDPSVWASYRVPRSGYS